MEALGVIFGVAFVIYLLVVLAGPFVAASHRRRLKEQEAQTIEVLDRLATIDRRLAQMNTALAKLEQAPALRLATLAQARPSVAAPASDAIVAGISVPTEPRSRPTADDLGAAASLAGAAEPTQTTAGKAAAPIEISALAWTGRDSEENTEQEFDEVAKLPGIGALWDRLVAAIAPGVTGADWETVVGGSVLNKLGVGVLVIGVALFLGYALQYFGPLGKVATGVAVAAVLLAAGVKLEGISVYALFARPLIGGGWALFYFTAYAAHNIAAARIVENPVLALGLLGLVAGGMIGHSLKYRSTLVTGMAFALGFIAIDISPFTVFSLVAIAILAAALVAVVRQIELHELALFGIAATYLSHFLWSAQAPVLVPASAGAFWLGEGALMLYWLLFKSVDFVRPPDNARREILTLAINGENTFAFLALSFIQVYAAFPRELYVLAAAGGLAYAATSILLDRAQRTKLHLLDGTVAIALFAIACPLALHPLSIDRDWLVVAWLVEAVVVFFLGVARRKYLFRLESYVLLAPVLLEAVIYNLNHLDRVSYAFRLESWATIIPVIGWLFLIEHLLTRRVATQYGAQEKDNGAFAGHCASLLLAAVIWMIVPERMVGAAWLAAGTILTEVGLRTARPHTRFQGYALAALAAAGALVINLHVAVLSANGGAAVAPLTAAIIVAGLEYLFWRIARGAGLGSKDRAAGVAAAYAGSAILILLIGEEFASPYVGDALLLAGLASFEIGVRTGESHARFRGYILAGLGVAALLLVNLYGLIGTRDGEFLPSAVLVGFGFAGLQALYHRLKFLAANGDVLSSRERRSAAIPAHAAAALAAVLAWKEFDAPTVAVAWGFLALVLWELGERLADPVYRMQGKFIALAAFARLFLANFIATGEVMELSIRVVTVGPILALLYYLRWRLTVLIRAGASVWGDAPLARALSFAAALGFVLLGRFELDRAHTVIAWAALAVAFLALGVLRREQDLRLQGYIIVALAFWRSWSTNFYLTGTFFGLDERIATTVPVIAALFAFSLLWRERRQAWVTPEAVSWRDDPVRWFDTHSTIVFSVGATMLLALLLFYTIEGNLLTVAWAIEGSVVLAAGFFALARVLRLCGLSLLGVCILKLFVLDLAGVDTLYRIASFIVLGALLVAVSFGYTRYGNVVRRYL